MVMMRMEVEADRVRRVESTLQFEVGPESARQRLDDFLAAHIGWLSRLRIAKLIAEGKCFVNDEPGNAGRRLRVGDRVWVEPGEFVPNAMTPEPIPLEIVYEDSDLLVVNKPSGMLVHPTRNVKRGTLANALTYYLNRDLFATAGQSEASRSAGDESPALIRPGIVHRLDRATSGLMVVAKNQRALSVLSRQFQRRLVEKSYLAIVHGRVAEDELAIRAPIGRDPEARPKWRVMEGGKESETRLRVLERRERRTLVELQPLTGRTNQLRIHCAHIGHPIVGDDWHGAEDHSTRLCLHAARLSFRHPSSGEMMRFSTALPAEMARSLDD
ncbi:RluA family pseudouridine synthase [Pyrinomonas methylaliphatogenes]|uniref:Pseudouridine synthase n=1 Tax=Pyrinomonas methylaliphatogenes TaxID=454194 RepID=A0A0B6WV98_9BACT|nr:RluA family pseudouridine synthase [Pyrinomonas methylaliphatogenes]MBX5479244.1 RluA family pseudouridine synthase [Pyrinomonas methylaliphatogenes]CDM65021.1 pseudouridine synthase, RluA family [Pyrinomonas methylaliphatogenes]